MAGVDRQSPVPDPGGDAEATLSSGGWSAIGAGASSRDGGSGWFRRHLLVGLGLGLGLGAVGQTLVVWLAPGELDATPWQRLAAVAYATSGWMVLSFLLAVLGSLLLRSRRGRVVATALSASVLGALALLSAVGSALRIISGSYLTVGAVMFSVGSADHFVHAAVEGYAGYFAIIVAAMALFSWLVWRALRPVARGPAQPVRRELVTAALLVVLVAGVYQQRGRYRFTKGMFLGAPLLALASSLETGYELERFNVRQGSIGERLAPIGPPLSSGAVWERAVNESEGPRPNVLLVLLESIAPGHMSLHGYERPTTPRIDALAAKSLVIDRAYSTATHSNYAQMAVLSSLFPRRETGLDQYTRLDYPRVLLHDTFHHLGYDTATVSSQDEHWQGMRKFQDTGTPTFFWFSEDFTGEHVDSGVEKVVPDSDTVNVAIEWLDRPRDEPWSLYINLQATHFPYTMEPDAERRWTPDRPTPSTFGYLGYPEAERDLAVNRYDNALRYVDEQVGRLLDHLEAKGELENTLVVITADHGEMFFEKGLVTHGKTLYEVESRVPMIVHWRGKVKPERRKQVVSSLDVLPTVLDLLERPAHPSWQGRSFVKTDPTPRSIFMNIQGLRSADGLVCWPYKLILERTSQKQYLFDLEADPEETNNLMEQRPEIAKTLADTLTKQLVAQLDYHRSDNDTERSKRYQPRLRACPSLD